MYDPPSDPCGDERRCRICDEPLEYNPLILGWECTQDHDAELDICPHCGRLNKVHCGCNEVEEE